MQTKTTKRQKKTVEDADFLLYNSDQDTAEVIEELGLNFNFNYLDSKRNNRYDDIYANDNY